MSQVIVSNHEVIPVISPDIFIGHENARLAVGVVAIGSCVTPGFEEVHGAYYRLRGNVYGGQQQFMPMEELNDDGSESDGDDPRSVHIALVENTILDGDQVGRVLGGIRVIVKSDCNEAPLPVENHYPEAFLDGPATNLSVELSRLIARHELPRVQKRLSQYLFMSALSHGLIHDLGPAYGAIEAEYLRTLAMQGVPVTALGDSKFVKEFNATKMPIRVDVDEYKARMRMHDSAMYDKMLTNADKFVYFDGAGLPVDQGVVVA
jgi:hypothetical protein